MQSSTHERKRDVLFTVNDSDRIIADSIKNRHESVRFKVQPEYLLPEKNVVSSIQQVADLQFRDGEYIVKIR